MAPRAANTKHTKQLTWKSALIRRRGVNGDSNGLSWYTLFANGRGTCRGSILGMPLA